MSQRSQVPASSVRGTLRARREKTREALYVDIPVPRYDPPIYLRCVAVPQGELESVNKVTEKSKHSDKTVRGAASVLIKTCRGIYVDGDSEKPEDRVSADIDNPDQDPPVFDDRLAALLLDESEKAPTAGADIVRLLFATDGDVIASSIKYQAWFFANASDDEDSLAGE